MRRLVYYGYNSEGKFTINTCESDPGFATEEQTLTLTRAECQKILKQMQFGKKGDERVIETVDGRELRK